MPKLTPPSRDGELKLYDPTGARISNPKIYYVNGTRVLPRDHAVTASLISLITERPVWGVYNQTSGVISGFYFDFKQCLRDYTQNATARMGSNRRLVPNRNIAPDRVASVVDDVMKRYVIWNQATATLFKTLAVNQEKMQLIVAHSQGNLITSNALFVLEQ